MEKSVADQEGAVPQEVQLDPERVEHVLGEMRMEQNLGAGAIAGVVAAVLGAVLWAVVTVATQFQIGFMAVGVGLLVGIAIRRFGRGMDPIYGVMGAAFSLLGCALGNLLSAVGFVSTGEDIPLGQVLSALNLEMSLEILTVTFHPMDLLFYGIAIYYGYKLAFRRVTGAEVERMVAPS